MIFRYDLILARMVDGPLILQEQIAFDLQRQCGEGWDFAWLTHQGKIYFARYPQNGEGPGSAVVKLIQFLFDEHVDQSFFILRNRIFSTRALSAMCEGMVQLAAKRATAPVQAISHGMPATGELIELGPPTEHFLTTRHEVSIDWRPPPRIEGPIEAYFHLQDLIRRIPRGEVLHDHNRPIAALICDSEGQLLSWAVNNNSKNKTLHAEVVAVQKYHLKFHRRLPPSARIYSSLKPCRMCAGMILEMAESPTQLETYYFQDDPGPLAQNTVLERQGLLKHYLLHDGCKTT